MRKKNLSKVIKSGFLVTLMLSMVAGYQTSAKADLNSEQYEGVYLNETNFPDENLRKILKPLDENKDGLISIMEQKNQEYGPELSINLDKGSVDLTGVSKLDGIRYVYIYGNKNDY